jgi:formylglycine-generating enzyme required for sulfatase activity
MKLHLAVKSPRPFFCVLAVGLFLLATKSKTEEPTRDTTSAADRMLGKDAGQVRDDNGLKLKLVWCPPGFVTMEQIELVDGQGNPVDESEAPVGNEKITPVKAFLTSGYWLGMYEVTQAEWQRLMATEPWKDKPMIKEGDRFPATCVNWDDAMDFCRRFSARERAAGRLPEAWQYTLPTEAQWERACRARTETNYSFGDDEKRLDDFAWFLDNARNIGDDFIHPVGRKKPNPWGLYDMHGNAWEWCRDYYSTKLPGGRDPDVTTASPRRSVRGGGFNSAASNSRSAFRGKQTPDNRWPARGFRVALSPVAPARPQ